MRIKNKEIRARRHRKEQKVKDAARETRAKYGEGKTTPAEKPAAAPKKAAPKAAAKTAKKPAEAAAKPAAPKKAAAPKAKKEEPAGE